MNTNRDIFRKFLKNKKNYHHKMFPMKNLYEIFRIKRSDFRKEQRAS